MEVKLGFPTSSPDTRNPRQVFLYYHLVNVYDDAFFWNMLNAACVNLLIPFAQGPDLSCIVQDDGRGQALVATRPKARSWELEITSHDSECAFQSSYQ
jgi:hypothetical protein